MAKKSAGGRDLGRSAQGGGLGPLGDLIGGLGGDSKSGLDDILGMARKFF